jgi:hypothetical protein
MGGEYESPTGDVPEQRMPVKDEPYTHVHFPSTRPELVLLALKAAAYESLANHLEGGAAARACEFKEPYRLLARVYRAAADDQSSGAL